MAKLANALGLKPGDRKVLRVRIPLRALRQVNHERFVMFSVKIDYFTNSDLYSVGFYRRGEFITSRRYKSTFEMAEDTEAWCQEGTEP